MRNYTEGKSAEQLIGYIGFGGPVEIDASSAKKVLITGAGSYIGESFSTYASTHYPSLSISAIDMLDGSWRDKAFSSYDIIYHVAGIAHADVGNVDEATKDKYYKVNTDLVVEVAEKAKAEGVKEFIFMSSMIVYGDSAPYGKKKVINKTTTPQPANFYGDSKLQADVAVRDLADDSFKVIVLRPPMIYGKGSKGNYPTLAKLAQKLPVFPKIENERSMLHIDNLCEFLCQIMLVKEMKEKKVEEKKENEIVLIPQNVEWIKTSEMVREIGEVCGKSIKLLKVLNPAVWVGSKVPGKIGGLVNKAFGNSCYAHEVSVYEGIDYQKIDLKESIRRTEGREPADKEDYTVGTEEKNNMNRNKPTSLIGKKVLLIALPGYSTGIIEAMKSLGAEVDYIHDKPDEGLVSKTLGRLQIGIYQNVLSSYYEKEIDKLKNRDYDYILSIRGEYTPISTLQLLRKVFPHAKLVLYMWDGLHKQNTRGIEKKWPYYDRVFTFDRYDYEENKETIDFLPLYYYDKYLPTSIKSANNEDLRYAVSFIGTAHDDRIKIVKSVMNQCKKDGVTCFSYFYMPHKLIYLKNKLFNTNFKNVDEDNVSYEMLPFEKLYQIYADSKCIVDVENKGQHGLTMRSIEILGLKRKFITTNKDIVNYDFYNPNNILVIDRDNPIVDREFFDTPYEELDEELYQKYSIKNWILEVLS